jgi:nitrite reductase (NO-forming)
MSKVLDRPVDVPPSGDGITTSPRAKRDGSLWWVLTTAVALLALIFAFVGVVLPRGGASDAAADLKTEFDVQLGDMFVKPASIEVPAGTPITLHVSNKGALPHDLQLNGTTGTKMLQPGDSETIVLPALGADAQAWCTVAGHKQAGMVMNIKVAGTASAGGGGPAAAPASNNAVFDPAAEFPAEFTPYDPTLAPAPGGTEHTLELHATEEVIEVAPGVRQKMWTFGGQVPGPTLRGKVGDLFTITLINDGEVNHSIDFHASKVAWNDEMRSIGPGESLVYQFKAEYAGIYMYHCGTPPALHHIGNGMYGAIVVDPPDLPAVDHEYVLVQSEMYFGPMDDIGDLAKMKSEQWDTVTFNGYANQYLHAPIRVETGERIRVWVLDAGPSENSAFHIVGTVFDTVYKEGQYLLQPGEEQGGSQVLDLQPAQGGFVEFTFAEDGLYPIVTHKFANPGKGALGLFQAGEVDTSGDAGH